MQTHLYKNDLPDNISFKGSVAVDSETLGLRPERDPLCLVQLSSGDGNAHLVQLDRENYNAPNLKKVLSDKSCQKIFHFARFDVAVLKKYLNIDCEPIYCTKIVSKLVRTYTDRHGLKDLCRELIGVDLSKQQQSSNWGAKELTEEQKHYAASDVLYLHQLKDLLDQELVKLNRKSIADECFSFIKTRVDLDLRAGDKDIFHIIISIYENKNYIKLKIELNGINKLFRLINLNFANIVSKLAKVKGKVIITGIGKSGHDCKKNSSTMSSTGTQSHFCHSTEMSHGDLGIISKNDVVIIISNSGSSTELNGVINFCKKNNIFTIGMSSLKNSNLMNSVNMGLIIPSAEEACVIGMAPTTSTTMALVLGDAICISLMKMKKFSTKNYRNIHPGGSLGENLIQVKKIMHTGSKIPLIDENASMKDAVIEITRKAFGHVGVLNKSKKLIGIITDGDLRRSIL